jgi:GNAT superfamily N-acetyltransferase
MLKALCHEYGSCGVMAVDGDIVIGKVRFYPRQVMDDIQACVQQNAERIAAFDPASLPSTASLDPAALCIHCVQVCEEYRGQRVGTSMLEHVIDWAHAEGWTEVRATAIPPIGPLLEWCGGMNVDVYRRLGFLEISRAVSPEHLEAVSNMRAGYHGDAVKRQWDAMGDISIEDAATVYEMALDLR